jgi:hypothetical protein
MTRRWFLSLVASAFILAAVGSPAFAEEKAKVNKAMAGKIFLSDKRYPSSAKSLGDFNAKIKKQSKLNFSENKEKQEWKIHFIGFLKAPLNDVEYLVKIYEVSGRGNQLLASFEQFTDSRGQTSLISHMTLEKKTVGVNKQLMITMESKGKVLCSARFKILGEGEKYNGKVDFSEEEANGGVKEEE